MKNLILGVILISSGLSFADSGVDFLIKDSSVSTSTPIIKQKKQITLDNPFLIQLYGVWKAGNIKDEGFNQWMTLVLEKKNQKALKRLSLLKLSTKKENEIADAAKLYLLWSLNLNQNLFNAWLNLSAEKAFLKTQLGLAIDQMIGKNASAWFLNNAIMISPDQEKQLKSISHHESLFNNSAQAVFSLRGGINNLELIGKLPAGDKLRLRLADSVILGYAKKNELAKSAKLLKEIYEPILKQDAEIETISDYYLLLARLLYQAEAYEASFAYYKLIPDESKNFLPAQVESLWISMRESNLARTKGDLESLTMNIFEDQFLPEVYLVSAMANLQLCQFNAVEKNFADYIRVQKKFAKLIAENLKSESPAVINENDFYYQYASRSIQNLDEEKTRIVAMKNENLNHLLAVVARTEKIAKEKQNIELKRKWNNRKKLLELSLRKMRFVKVEFLSKMRRLKRSLAKNKVEDNVKMVSAGISKTNNFVFPYDGVRFSDELFHYQSELTNLCLRGKQ